MSLWNGPNKDMPFQETTISALKAKVESDDGLLVASLKAGLEEGSYTGDRDINEVYDAICDYEDVRDDEDSSRGDIAQARRAMMETVGDSMGVQVASSPWERIKDLAEKPREY